MTAQDYLQKWIKETYPLMDSADYCELDYYDMQKFAVWIVKLLATPAVSKSVEPVRKPTVCVHPIPQRTYVGRGWLKCGVCGEEFQ